MLGIDDIVQSVNEFAEELDGLRDEIVTSLVEPGKELKDTVDDISESLETLKTD